MYNQLVADSIFLKFGEKRLLNGIYLKSSSGEVTGILGRNGSGKTCLLKIISGILPAQASKIRIDGEPIKKRLGEIPLINYLPQSQFHPVSVNLKNLCHFYHINPNAFFEEFAIPVDLWDLPFGQLSGGWKRLVEVLLVVASPSRFSLLDEPFSHIMPLHIDLVKGAITRRLSEKGFIITDHQWEHVAEMSQSLFLVNEGHLVPIFSKDDLMALSYISNY